MDASKKKCGVLVCLPLLLVLIASTAHAQSQIISGTVVDQKGAVVPNANVKITDQVKKNLARQVSTDEEGRFQALSVQPGLYSITVEAPGFKTLQRSEVRLDVNTKLDVGELRLEIGDVSDTVSVTAEIPLVQTNTGEKAFTVNAKQIEELPLNGRNWVALMSTVPGVTSCVRSDFPTDFNDVSGMRVLGGRGSQNNFYLDGSPNLDAGDNQSQYTQPSVYSIGEFKVQQSSFNAEYGRNSGVVVAVQTKSGGSSFHGTAYEYVRNDAFDAKRPDSVLKDKLRYNLFGGNIGGWIPIPKVSTRDNKKVFFFYNREMTRRQLVSSGSSFVDLPGARTLVNGDFSAFLTNTPMECAPQFNVGTVFQPGTVRYGSSGACANKIIGGTPFAGNIVPPSLWNSASSSLLKIFTEVPGFASFPGAPNPGLVRWFFSSPGKLVKNQDLLRIDYNLNASTTTFFRWVNDDQTQFQPVALWGNSSFGTQPPIGAITRPKPGSSWSWNIVKTISSTMASETILSFNHQSQSLSPADDSIDRNRLGATFTQLYPSANTTNSLPNFQAPTSNGITGIGMAWGSPGWHNIGKDYALTENFSWVKQSHSMKFGFYYNRDNKQQTANFGTFQGQLNFLSDRNNPGDTGSPLANLLLGNLSSYTQANAHVYPYFRFQSWEGYAQDSWKVNRRLTLEYGLRFQHTLPTYTYTREGTPGGEGTFKTYSVDVARYSAARAPRIDVDGPTALIGNAGDNGQSVLAMLLANGLVCDPCDGVPRGFADAKTFISPRIGFAYDPRGDGKTAIRGGFGQYVERLRQNNFNFGAGDTFPNLTGAGVFNTNINNITPGPAGLTGRVSPQTYNVFPSTNTMPTIYSWNLGIQRDLGHNFGLDISYVGNHANHLMVQRPINGTAAGYFLDNPTARRDAIFDDALRPYRGFASLTSIETSGTASYNGMLARLTRRLSAGFQFNVNYTWSRTFDVVDNDSDTLANPLDMRANWAPAGHDATHSLTLDYVYELPGFKGNNLVGRTLLTGWQISGITHYQSGFPFSIASGSNQSLQGIDAGTQFVDLIGDPYAGQTENRWLNPAAFARPQEGQRGSLHRNALRGPGYLNWDASLSKLIRFKETVNLKLGMDVFNLFNHPQVFGINTTFAGDVPGAGISTSTRGTFGTISSFRDQRVLQFGARLQF
jgi:hypothetical protein